MISLHQREYNFSTILLQVQEIASLQLSLKNRQWCRAAVPGVTFNFLWFHVSYPKSYKVHLAGTKEKCQLS